MPEQVVKVTNSDRINNGNWNRVMCLGYWVGYSLEDWRIVVQLPQSAKHYYILLGL